MTDTRTNLLIIGSGPAGLTAAIYAARAGLRPILLEGFQPGGQLMITNEVENYPPFASTTGPGLMAEMRNHAEAAGVDIRSQVAETLLRDPDSGDFCARIDSREDIHARAVVLATGAKAKWLGLPSEEEFMGRGVSACATCDGFFYQGGSVVVVGGGNTAVEEALYLSGLAASVTLVCRGPKLKAEKILQDRLTSRENVRILWSAEVSEILGDAEGVTGAVICQQGQHSKLAADGVFVAIGHSPATSLVEGLVDLDSAGYVVVRPGSTMTSCPGLFAAGDVGDPIYRQAITSAGMGCMAALDAERYLASRH